MEASDEGEGEEEEYDQESPFGKGGQEAPETESGQLDQILESISDMASYVTLLQIQADRDRQMLQNITRPEVPLRRAPSQAHQAGHTRTGRQGTPTFPPVPSQNIRTPAFPPAPTQARGTPTFLLAPNLAHVTRTSKTMDRVAATAPDPSIPGFPGNIFLLKAWANTTPQTWI